MDVTTETLSPTRVKLTVTVPFEDLQPGIASAYKKVGSQLRVPGFRPGKVPRSLVDQRVGRAAILDEALQEALPEFYGRAVEEQQVAVLARPEVDVTTFADGDPLVFTAEVDVRPELELPAYDAIAISVDDADVSDEDVDNELEELRRRRADLVEVERAAEAGDLLTIDFTTSVDGEELPGGGATGLSYTIGDDSLIPGLDAAITGAAVDSPVTFDTELTQGEQAGKAASVTATVKRVRERVLPALDDAFASTAGPYDTVDALKEVVRDNLVRTKRLQQGLSARDKALEQLLEVTEVPLPESVVHTEAHARIDSMVNQLQQYGLNLPSYLSGIGRTEEDWHQEQHVEAEKAVRAQLLLDAIASKEELEVTGDELTAQLINRAQRSGVSPDALAQNLMANNSIGMLVEEVRRGKALALVLEGATVTDASGRPVDLEALRDDPSADVEEIEELADELDELG